MRLLKNTPKFLLVLPVLCLILISGCTIRHSGSNINHNRISDGNTNFFSFAYLKKCSYSHLPYPYSDSIAAGKFPSIGIFQLQLPWDSPWKTGKYYCVLKFEDGTEKKFDIEPLGLKVAAGGYSISDANSTRFVSWGNYVHAFVWMDSGATHDKFTMNVFDTGNPAKSIRLYKVKVKPKRFKCV